MRAPCETRISGASLRSAGDRARDFGNWVEAIENYSAYLRDNPGDFAIWVQLGHAHKECGSYDKALAAYDKAVELHPNDFDLHLNRGHLLKLAGDREGAISAYTNHTKYTPRPMTQFPSSSLFKQTSRLSICEEAYKHQRLYT